MATSSIEVEVITLTGNAIDEIAPERAEDVAAAEQVFLLESVRVSELVQALFDLAPLLPRRERAWLRAMIKNASREPGCSTKANAAASPRIGAVSGSRAAPPNNNPSSLCEDTTADPGPENEADWEDLNELDAKAQYVPLPASVASGWTAINAPKKLRRSKCLITRARQIALKTNAPPARSRSSSVEFPGERVVRAASPPPGLKTEPEYRALGRSILIDALRQAKEAVKNVRRTKQAVKKAAKLKVAQGEHRAIHATAARASTRSANLAETTKDTAELIMYTDGSVKSNRYGGGAVVYKTGNTWAGRAIALGDVPYSTQTEMAALFAALNLARNVLQPNQRRLTIVTDSSSSLTWVANGGCNDELMVPTVKAACQLQQKFAEDGLMVTFQWVKGHAGLEGNEMADMLASFASQEASRGHQMNYDIADIKAHLAGRRSPKAIRQGGLWNLMGSNRSNKQPEERRERKLQLRKGMNDKVSNHAMALMGPMSGAETTQGEGLDE